MSGASSVSYAQAAMGHPPASSAFANTSKEEQSHLEKQQPTKSASANSKDAHPIINKMPATGSDDAEVISKTNEPRCAIANTGSATPAREQPEVDADEGHVSTDVSSLDGDKTSTTSVNTHIPSGDGLSPASLDDSKGHQEHPVSSSTDSTAGSEGTKEAVKIELIEAPVPRVNIWQQRREAQLAKTKFVAPSTPTSATEAGNPLQEDTKSGPPEQRRGGKQVADKESFVAGQASQGGRPRKGESARADGDVGRRNAASRGPKASERESDIAGLKSAVAAVVAISTEPIVTAPPPVNDASLWPTLDGASQEERRRMSEKAERPEKETVDDGNGTPTTKSRARGWLNVELDYRNVLPPPASQPRNSRGRGGARGGSRTGSTQAPVQSQTPGQSQTSEVPAGGTQGTVSPEKAPIAPTLPVLKTTADTTGTGRDRERDKDRERGSARDVGAPPNTAASASSLSMAPPSQRSTGDGSGGREARQATAVGGTTERSKDLPTSGTSVGGYMASDAKQHAYAGGNGSNTYGKQGHSQHMRDRPEGRTERGRGGYRGRGGHHGAASAHSHGVGSGMSTVGEFKLQTNLPSRPPAHVSPQGKQPGFGVSGQSHVGHASASSAHGHPHGNSRSRGGHRSGNTGGHQRIGSQQAGGLPGHHGHPASHLHDYSLPSPMGTMPSYPMGSYSVAMAPEGFALLKAQVEYYFSVDNLCKDMYLRSHMDGQGFVPLAVIAQFKRIRDITDETEALGNACEDSAKLDIVISTNGLGTELVRSRTNWLPFVLPVGDRKPLAQHGGPSELVYRSRLHLAHHWYPSAMGYPATPTGAAYPNNGGLPDHAYRMDPMHRQIGTSAVHGMTNGLGVSGHVSETSLSAAVSEFSPSALHPPPPMLPNSGAAPFVPAADNDGPAEYVATIKGVDTASQPPLDSPTDESAPPPTHSEGVAAAEGAAAAPASAEITAEE